MSMKLNVGLSRKIGESNYGSRGASCHVEVELDFATLSHDPARFQQRAQEAFAACRQAVEEELAQSPAAASIAHQRNNRTYTSPPPTAGPRVSTTNSPRPATAAQVKAIRAIAHRAGIQLASELNERYGVHSPEGLDLRQASQLIDVLKEQFDAQSVG
ncbi:hypothetical protein [Candidatus Laterigemmans baculatus]|uniref:hypothetical protein n=1 Tax=Candidatus Laterigemmans baculatus TaxID=2770505 RepID=UPI0013DCD586|nr:hypothetical protein [Candidatus Laterigemmans baculatus]